MGALKQLLIAAEEGGMNEKEAAMWGALCLDKEHLIPECLHDSDKPWRCKDASLKAQVEV